MIRVNIVPNDSRQVAKVVIINDNDEVLMLKRSGYVDKYAGEWDLPGGHIQVGEDFAVGMKREVKEETGLDIDKAIFVEKIENLEFYYCMYNGEPITLSHEHTSYKFFPKSDLDPNEKFEKVALNALEKNND